jgi:benzylsuccinate CoA-transferase BbsF subunit
MGAEVIRIESMIHLDFARMAPDPLSLVWKGPDKSTTFISGNTNKLSVRLDVSKPKGLEIAKRLIQISDIVTENFTPGVMNRLGLDYETLKNVKADIIMFSSSANGATGPEAHVRGYAPIFTALSGLGEMIGYPDGPPTEVRATRDFTSAMYGFFAIMAALVYRQRTGEGEHIEMSSREAIACTIGDSLMDCIMNGRVQTRTGNWDDIMAPHNCYRCKGEDKWVSVAISNQEEWEALCRTMGNPEWTNEDKFSNEYSRWQNQEELDRNIGEWTINYTYYQVMEMLQKVGVAAIPSLSADDLYADPHLNERKCFQVVEHSEMGAHLIITCPWKFSATPPRVYRDSPLIGQHNDYVYGELLGMSKEEIEQLTEEKILY